MVTQSFSQYRMNDLNEIQNIKLPKVFEFEREAKKLITLDGSIKNKSIPEIAETAKIVKDKIDNLLEQVYNTHSILPDFFICSKSF